MKSFRYILIFVLVVFAIGDISAQAPCNYFSGPNPDSLTLISQRKSIEVKKIPAGISPPIIDGKIDLVWIAVDNYPLLRKRIGYSIPDSKYKAISNYMFDENWLYVLVLITGDKTIDTIGSMYEQDRLEFGFQNTFGGKGTTADHCNDPSWRAWYWEQDGDKHFKIPINPDAANFLYLDQDTSDNCGIRPTQCSDVEGPDWTTLSANNEIQYSSAHSGDTIIYEMAFHLLNFLNYSSVPDSGFAFGWDICTKNNDENDLIEQLNFNDPDWNFWAYTPALAKAVFSGEFGKKHNINFNVFDDYTYDNIENAIVTIPPYPPDTTASNGRAQIDSVFGGGKIYPIIIEAPGYLLKTDSVSVHENTLDLNIGMQKAYSLHFQLFDSLSKAGIEGAEIAVEGFPAIFSNSAGEATFHKMAKQSSVAFSVYHDSYKIISGITSIIDRDDTVSISMVPVFDLTFELLDSTNSSPIKNAMIQIPGYGSGLSDANGRIKFSHIPLEENLCYSVTANNYKSFLDTIDVLNSHQNKTIKLSPGITSYSISFSVKNSNERPVKDATINFNQSISKTTDKMGNVLIVGILPGKYNYIIEKHGYVFDEGTIEIVNSSISKSIILEYNYDANITPASTTEICEGDSILLIANYSPYLSWQWKKNSIDIPDATAPYFFAKSTGDYTVEITNTISEAYQLSNLVHVTVSSSNFNLDFSGDNINHSSSPFTTQFNNTSDNISLFNYTWYFGNGDTSSLTHPNYTFPYNGTFDVTLVATDKIRGCSDHITKSGFISATGGDSCNINNLINVGDSISICSGDSVYLEVAASNASSVYWFKNKEQISIDSSLTGTWINSSGKYYASLSNSICQTTTKKVHIEEHPLIEPFIVSDSRLTDCYDSIEAHTGYWFTSYQWSNGDTTTYIKDYLSNEYTVTVTDIFGCQNISEPAVLNASLINTPEICAVTASWELNKNKIAWSKEENDNLYYYTVYKLIDGRYRDIGVVFHDQLSMYIDTTSDPTLSSEKYKLSATDTCGNETLLSPYKQSIFLSRDQLGYSPEIFWNSYPAEESISDIDEYQIYSGNFIYSMILLDQKPHIDSVDIYSYTTSPNYRFYYIKAPLLEECIALDNKKAGAVFTASYSNIISVDFQSTMLQDISQQEINVFPNPADDFINLFITNQSHEINSIKILSIEGKVVHQTLYKSNPEIIDVSYLSSGIYLLLVQTHSGIITQKFIKN